MRKPSQDPINIIFDALKDGQHAGAWWMLSIAWSVAGLPLLREGLDVHATAGFPLVMRCASGQYCLHFCGAVRP